MEYSNRKYRTTRTLQTMTPKKYPSKIFQDNRKASNVLQCLIILDKGVYSHNSSRGRGFFAETKEDIPTGDGEQICHKISFNDFQIIIEKALNENNFVKLDKLARALGCSTDELKREYSNVPPDYGPILQKANKLLLALNNSLINLRAGIGSINQGIRNHFDPNFEDHEGEISMTPISKTLFPFAVSSPMLKDDQVRSSTFGKVKINTLSPKTSEMILGETE